MKKYPSTPEEMKEILRGRIELSSLHPEDACWVYWRYEAEAKLELLHRGPDVLDALVRRGVL